MLRCEVKVQVTVDMARWCDRDVNPDQKTDLGGLLGVVSL